MTKQRQQEVVAYWRWESKPAVPSVYTAMAMVVLMSIPSLLVVVVVEAAKRFALVRKTL
jgi:hypothetical protein